MVLEYSVVQFNIFTAKTEYIFIIQFFPQPNIIQV